MSEERDAVAEPAASSFYRVSGVATVVLTALFLFDVVAFFGWGPYPASAEGWFDLLRNDRATGLLLLSFPTLVGTALYYLTFLGLGLTLRRAGGAYAGQAALFAFVGLTIMLVSMPAHTLVVLADQHAVAASESRRALLLAAGEARLAASAAGINLGGLLLEGAALAFSILMLRSDVYGKTTAWLGIVGHGLDLSRIALILAFVPEGTVAILLMIGGLPQLLWLVLVGRTLYRLGDGSAAP